MFTSANARDAIRRRPTLLKQRKEQGRVTPEWELQSYRAVTLREREYNQRHTAGDRANTGVYVLTGINVGGMSEFRAKRPGRIQNIIVCAKEKFP